MDVEKFNKDFHYKLNLLYSEDILELNKICLQRTSLVTIEGETIEERDKKLRLYDKYWRLYESLVNELGGIMSGWDGFCFANAIKFCNLNGIREIKDVNGILRHLLNDVGMKKLFNK